MNISVSRSGLRDALATATSIATRKSTLPVLANALLRASDKTLSITATDLRVAFTSQIECTAKIPGTLALDAKALLDIVASLPSDDLTLRATDTGGGEIRAGKSRFQLAGAPTQDFPAEMKTEALKFCPVDAKAFAQMVSATGFAASKDEMRAHLAGVHIDFRDKAYMISSDGHRCALIRGKVGGKLERAVLAPVNGLRTIIGAVGETTEIEIAVTHAEMFARIGKTIIGVKLIEAEFPPNTVGFFRVDSEHEMIVGREALISAVKRVALMTDKEGNYSIRLALASGALSLSSKGAGKGIGEDEIPVSYSGQGHETAVNAAYFVEALESLHAEEVIVGFHADGYAPIQVRPAGESETEHAVLVMPQKK